MRTRWAFGAVAAVVLLSACTGDDDGAADAGDGAPAVAEPSGELTVWLMDPGTAAARTAVDAGTDAFEAEHPAVTISLEYLPRAEAQDRLAAAVAAGTMPDLAETSTTWTTELAEQGALAPAAPAEGVGYVECLVESGTVDGTSYGYPWYGGAQALIYRTDLLAQAGAAPPTTWDEVFSVGDTIAAELPGIAPMHVGGAHLDLLAPLVWAAGGDIATRAGSGWRSGIDSAAGREAFSHFESVWKKGWSPPDAVAWTAGEVRTAFADGDSAMMIGEISDLRWILSTHPELDGRVAAALLPAGPAGNRDAVASGSLLVVLDGSGHGEPAAALARHLTAPEQVVAFTKAVGLLPGTADGVEEVVAGDEALGSFGEQFVEHSRTYPATEWWREVVETGALRAATQQLMQGQLTAHEAAAAIDTAIQGAIG